MSKFVVGLTGGIGSGKSEVSRRLELKGITVVDADVVARQVVEPNQPALTEIQNHFGVSILNTDGTLNRSKLRSIIFSNSQEKKWLENLLHPIIRKEIITQLSNSSSDYSVLSSPLLLETNQSTLVHRILVVDASEQLQLERAMTRDNNSIDQIQKIMATQMSRIERCKAADDIIHNFGDLHSLDMQIQSLHQQYLNFAHSKN